MDAEVAETGRDLAGTLASVLQALPGAPHQPQRLARMLGVNVVLTSRLLKATRSTDALAIAHTIPGPEPLRRVLKIVQGMNVDADVVRAAEEAVDRFEHLINSHAGDRAALDSMISSWLPDVRTKLDLVSRQAVFKGMSHIRGYTVNTGLTSVLLTPSTDPAKCDRTTIIGRYGLRRTRAGVKPTISTSTTAREDLSVTTLDGRPVGEGHSTILDEFSNSVVNRLEVLREGELTRYLLGGDEVGLRTAVDLVIAEHRPRVGRAVFTEGSPNHAAYGDLVEDPLRQFVFDILVHDDVYPGRDPQLAVYNSVGAGFPAFFLDPSRRWDLVDCDEKVVPLGHGIRRFRTASIPNYLDVLEHACKQRGYDPVAFRGYRLQIAFPLIGYTYLMGFELSGAASGENMADV
ncbi:MAG: hypothetical protein EA376_11665 [Phycisphaeraceae bacterium]|nr:MAG: hypothetical protein EA376_11665 [Phycisphaeraceae bacterium]